MPKQILGDNPFEDEAGEHGVEQAERADARPGSDDARPETDDAGPETDEVRAEDLGEASAAAPNPREAEPAELEASDTTGDGRTNGARPAGQSDDRPPEQAGGDRWSADDDWSEEDDEQPRGAAELGEFWDEVPDAGPDTEELFLGGEAAVPPGEYGPPISSKLPERAVTSEMRELERRVRARLTPAFPIEHRRRLPMEFLWKRYRHFAMRDRSDVVDEFGRDPSVAARVEPLLDFLYTRYFRVDTAGIEHVPDAGRALLVANHSGTLPYDGAILMHAMRREHPGRRDVRPLVENFVFHFPYLGTFINRIGGVRACQENAERLLDSDQLVAVFPEGVKGIGKLYRERYKLQRFGRGGFIKLALRTRAPIIPVAIVGAEETHPMLSKVTWLARSVGMPYVPITPTFPLLGPLGLMPLPAKWFLRFGEPLDLAAEYGPEAADDRILVNRLSEVVRSRIQGMIDRTLEQRRSIVFG